MSIFLWWVQSFITDVVVLINFYLPRRLSMWTEILIDYSVPDIKWWYYEFRRFRNEFLQHIGAATLFIGAACNKNDALITENYALLFLLMSFCAPLYFHGLCVNNNQLHTKMAKLVGEADFLPSQTFTKHPWTTLTALDIYNYSLDGSYIGLHNAYYLLACYIGLPLMQHQPKLVPV